jgi:hypothetical protein
MKNIIQTAALLAMTCLFAGCATPVISTHEKTTGSYANYILGLQTAQVRKPAEAIVAPIHLAVAQVGEPAPAGEMLARLKADSALIASVAGLPLPAENNPQNAQAESKDQSADFAPKVKAVCNVAASVGADYVFIYGSCLDSWQEPNSLMILDATVIGAVTIPSIKINCECRAAGALIRTATAEPIFFVTVEEKRSGSSPSYLVSGKTESLRAELRDEVTRSLTRELMQKLAQTK